MELFTLSVMNQAGNLTNKLFIELKREMAEVLSAANGVELIILLGEDPYTIKCLALLPGFQRAQSADLIYELAAKGVSAFIIKEWESVLIREILTKDYDYKDKPELLKLEKYCHHMLNDSGVMQNNSGTVNRMNGISKEFKKYLQENSFVNLNGFIRFRLKTYISELRELVEYAVDEYVMDKQYYEFISLLKYYVYIQEIKIPLAHLIHKGENEFIIMNEQMQPVESAQGDSVVLEMVDKDINYEDMVVSTLITVSPRQIIIHTRTAETQVVKTIENIFEGRVQICSHCHICHTFFGNEDHDEYPILEKLSLPFKLYT